MESAMQLRSTAVSSSADVGYRHTAAGADHQCIATATIHNHVINGGSYVGVISPCCFL
jgi:hypothetical protein